ncbi:SMI1/KNR4 family protein [Brevibacillus sp. 179-C9.3 HS]|uniref:SMI1/KNR4 family protein n=1 Tax=unclassified Brevibacillus TaxID=2684853 RepID=UPI0039A2AECB
MPMQQRMEMWFQAWNSLMQDMERQGARVWPLIIDPPALLDEIEAREKSLGISFPPTIRKILQEGSRQVQINWSLPSRALDPFSLSGDLGWSLDAFEWPYFGVDEECEDDKRYLSFHVGGNGDMLLIDLSTDAEDPPVYSWGHETGEFLLLGKSFTEFIERVTELGCIGAESWNYEALACEDGLDVEGQVAQEWKEWLQAFRTLTLDEAVQDFEKLVVFAKMHGAEDERIQAAFAQYDWEQVLHVWVKHIEQETTSSNLLPWCQLIVKTVGKKAESWVLSLWESEHCERLGSSLRAYVTAVCLPEEEGLQRVIAEMDEVVARKECLLGYAANSHLHHFRAREVILWMEPHVAYPIEGWDDLFAVSRPQWHDLIRWLDGNEAQRQIALSAWGKMLANGESPAGEADWQEIHRLLDVAYEKAILRKEKERVDRIRSALETTMY